MLLCINRVIDGFFNQIGGLNPASPLEMAALKSRLTDSRRAVLIEQWEIFTHTNLYLDTYKAAQAKAEAEAVPLRAFDRPYSGGIGGGGGGGGGGAAVRGSVPINARDDTYQSSKKGQYPGQYLEPYRGSSHSNAYGQGQGHGMLANPKLLAPQNTPYQGLTTNRLHLAQPVSTGPSHMQTDATYRPQVLSHPHSHLYQQIPAHAAGQPSALLSPSCFCLCLCLCLRFCFCFFSYLYYLHQPLLRPQLSCSEYSSSCLASASHGQP